MLSLSLYPIIYNTSTSTSILSLQPLPYMCISVFLSLSLSLPLYLSISVSLYLFTSLPLYLSISLSLYISISLHLYLSISVSLYLSLYLCLFLSLPHSIPEAFQPNTSFFTAAAGNLGWSFSWAVPQNLALEAWSLTFKKGSWLLSQKASSLTLLFSQLRQGILGEASLELFLKTWPWRPGA